MRSLAKLRKDLRSIQSDLTVEHYDVESFVAESIETLKDYTTCCDQLNAVYNISDLRFLLRYNLFILLTCGCNRKHLINQWAYDRCLEIQKQPDGMIDLWAREHYKSTIITFGKTIQDIMTSHGEQNKDVNQYLLDQLSQYINIDQQEEATIGIFSCTKTLAESFLWEIKKELEQNIDLQSIYHDIFYKLPDKYSDKWSMQSGINVKRKSVRKEATVEAWGLITGQPTGKHFSICVYDDIITHDIVKTLYLTAVATTSWENSLSLGSQNGVVRYVGTRKHYNDTYSEIIRRNAATLRRYTPYKNNDISQGLALFTPEEAEQRRKSMGETTWASEYLQEPLKDSAISFDTEKVRYHTVTDTSGLSLYMYCDPANAQKERRAGKKGSDFTVYSVIGIDRGGGLILIDCIRDRLSPSQKFDAIYSLWEKYKKIKNIYYEETGLCSDIAQFKERATERNHLTFTSLFVKLSSRMAKQDRLIKLEPLLEQGKLFVPKELIKKRINGQVYNLTEELIKREMMMFPFSEHDDIMDTLAYAAIDLENGTIYGMIDEIVVKKPISSSGVMRFARF